MNPSVVDSEHESVDGTNQGRVRLSARLGVRDGKGCPRGPGFTSPVAQVVGKIGCADCGSCPSSLAGEREGCSRGF